MFIDLKKKFKNKDMLCINPRINFNKYLIKNHKKDSLKLAGLLSKNIFTLLDNNYFYQMFKNLFIKYLSNT